MSLHRFTSVPLLFVTLWAIWFLLPLTRLPATSQWKARLGVPSIPTPDSRDAQYVRALDARPTVAPNVGATSSSGEARAIAFRTLSRKFPNDPDMCAAQIVNMTIYFRLGSGLGGSSPLARTAPGWSVSAPPKKIFNQEQLQDWFEATARGAKLEPNNTFWDWARLIGALMKGDNDGAWSVLRAARGKTGYDDHVADGALAQLRVLQENGPVSTNRQLYLASGILLPHYSQMREATRQIRDSAFQLQQRGDTSQKKRALEGMRDLMELARSMRRESKLYLGSIVGRSLETLAFYGGSDPLTLFGTKFPRTGSPLSTYARDPRSLLLRARQMNRPDIVQQVSREWNEVSVWSNKINPVINSTSGFLMGVEQRDFWLAQTAHWVTPLLIAAIPTLLAIALACSVLLALVPSWKREREVQPAPVSWLWGMALGLLVLTMFLASLFWTLHRSLLATTYDPPLPLWLSMSYSDRGASNVQLPLSWQQHFSALLSLTVALWLAATWNERRIGLPTLGARLRHILVAPDDDIARFDFSPLLSLTITFAILSAVTLGILGVLLPQTALNRYFSVPGNENALLLIIAALGIIPAQIRLRTAHGRALALVLIRRFAWSQLLFITILWGLLWLVAMPVQTRFDQSLNRSLQFGDMQLLRKQLGL